METLEQLKRRRDELRQQIQSISAKDIVYQDTDSVYLNCSAVVEKHCGGMTDEQKIEWLVQFADGPLKKATDMSLKRIGEMYQARVPEELAADREAVCRRGVWVAGKTYSLSVSDMEGVRYTKPEVKSTGLALVKSSTPSKAKDVMKEFMEALVGEGDVEKARRIALASRFDTSDMAAIAEVQGVSDVTTGDLGDGLVAKGTTKGAKACIAYNNLVERRNASDRLERITNSEKVNMVPLTMPNPARVPVIAWKGEWPEEFADIVPYVDVATHYEKTVIKPLSSILKAMKIELVEKPKLDLF